MRSFVNFSARVGRFKAKDKGRLFRKYLKIVLWPALALLAPLLMLVFSFLPRAALRRFANAVGRVWFAVSPASRRIGLDNLDLIYGAELSPAAKRALVLASIQSILRAVFDYFYFLKHSETIAEHVLIDPADRRRLEQIKQTGAIILSAHLGNWELLMTMLTGAAPVNLLARNQKHFEVIIAKARGRYGIKTVHDSSREVKDLAGRLHQGELLFCILDRNVSHAKGVVVDFMGQPAFTPYFPVNMAYYGQVPVIPAFIVEEGAKYRLVLGTALTVVPLADRSATYHHYCECFTAAIGDQIRLTPEQWFWAHKRWSRPKGDVLQ